MKPWRLAAVLLAAPHLFAASDLAVVSFSSDKTVAQFAERVTITTRVTNLGPDAAPNVVAFINFGYGHPTRIVVPAGWTCSAVPFEPTSGVGCTIPELATGAEADLQVTVLQPPTGGTQYSTEVRSQTAPDPSMANNTRTLSVTRTAVDTRSDLAVTTPQAIAGPAGQPAIGRASVTNNGPSSVSKVHLIVGGFSRVAGVQINGSGPGWTCTSYGDRLQCERASLAAGETAYVDVSFVSNAESIRQFQFVTLAEKNEDPVASNNSVLPEVGVGNATDWKMFLIPLDAEEIEGAGGSVWITDMTLFLRSDTTVDVRPELCDLPIFDCTFPQPPPPQPVNEVIDFQTRWNSTLGQYFYVPAADAHKVNMNIRIYDASRSTSTGGAEIPFVSEDEFTTGTASLLGIPLADEHRYTLRVYDGDGRGGRVLVHVYADKEKTPRKSTLMTLVPGGSAFETTTAALLPIHPATLQANPIEGIQLEGVQKLRIDVQPMDAGLRLWSFVSITNNETHHVTTVSQQ